MSAQTLPVAVILFLSNYFVHKKMVGGLFERVCHPQDVCFYRRDSLVSYRIVTVRLAPGVVSPRLKTVHSICVMLSSVYLLST